VPRRTGAICCRTAGGRRGRRGGCRISARCPPPPPERLAPVRRTR